MDELFQYIVLCTLLDVKWKVSNGKTSRMTFRLSFPFVYVYLFLLSVECWMKDGSIKKKKNYFHHCQFQQMNTNDMHSTFSSVLGSWLLEPFFILLFSIKHPWYFPSSLTISFVPLFVLPPFKVFTTLTIWFFSHGIASYGMWHGHIMLCIVSYWFLIRVYACDSISIHWVSYRISYGV